MSRDPQPTRNDLPVRAGDVLALAEDDYRFGLGVLMIRVTALLHLQELPDGPWLYLRGIPIRWDGSEGDPRQVLVRVSALARSRRGHRPPPA